LQQDAEGNRELELHDHDGLLPADGQDVAIVDFTFYFVPLGFQETFEGRVEVGFLHGVENCMRHAGWKAVVGSR
jgi:hypothetical protein